MSVLLDDAAMGNSIGSTRLRQIQVVSAVALAIIALRNLQVDKHPQIAHLNKLLSSYQPWQILLITLTALYALSNAPVFLGIHAPLTAHLISDSNYSPSFVRIRHLLVAMDAATLSTLRVPFKPLRDTAMALLAVYYVIFSKAADSKVQSFRSGLTVEQIKACFEKGDHPLLKAFNTLTTKTAKIHDQKIFIPTSPPLTPSDTVIPAVECSLFYDKPLSSLASESRLVLDLPGGGFIAQSPEHHSDYLTYWAMTLQCPILSVNYRKAPEHPFPAALDDCYHVYKQILNSQGAVIGINTAPSSASAPTTTSSAPISNNLIGFKSSKAPLTIALVGDSAGGNLVCAVTLRCLMDNVDVPRGLHLIYPCLDLAAEVWRSLAEAQHQTNVDGETDDDKMKPIAPNALSLPPGDNIADATLVANNAVESAVTTSDASIAASLKPPSSPLARRHVAQLSTRSIYAFDSILPLKYQLIIAEAYLRCGGDPLTDPLVSPLRAPLHLLRRFPPTFIHCGGTDPLLDDSISFQKKLRRANQHADVRLTVIPRVSHAYMHVTNILPEGRAAAQLSAQWIAIILGINQPAKQQQQQQANNTTKKQNENVVTNSRL